MALNLKLTRLMVLGRFFIACCLLSMLTPLTALGQDHSPSHSRPTQSDLSAEELFSELETIIWKDKILKQVQKQKELFSLAKTSEEFTEIKKEILFLLKKQESHLEKIKLYQAQLKNNLPKYDVVEMEKLYDELSFQVAELGRFFVAVSKKESEKLITETDFALPPQLSPEIPVLFDEKKAPRFFRWFPKSQPTIEPN